MIKTRQYISPCLKRIHSKVFYFLTLLIISCNSIKTNDIDRITQIDIIYNEGTQHDPYSVFHIKSQEDLSSKMNNFANPDNLDFEIFISDDINKMPIIDPLSFNTNIHLFNKNEFTLRCKAIDIFKEEPPLFFKENIGYFLGKKVLIKNNISEIVLPIDSTVKINCFINDQKVTHINN
jgi:hypothetical protein